MNGLVNIDRGMVQLFGTYVFEARLVLLFTLIGAAVIIDVRTYRIPNLLAAAGAAIGMAWHVVPPYGSGLAFALQGAAVGCGLFLPMYALRVVGAGDVKLMAMVGVFLGPAATAGAVLSTLIAGGVLAIAVALGKGVLPKLVANLGFMVSVAATKLTDRSAASVNGALTSAGKLPYALAIAIGTLSQVVLAYRGHALFG